MTFGHTAMRATRTAMCVAILATCVAAPASPARAQSTAPSRSVTLEEARRLALVVDPDAVAARGSVRIAGWERRAAAANTFTPVVTATTGYTRFSEPFFNFGTGDISSNATSATIEARYFIVGGGKLSERRRASALSASADANELAARYRVTLAADIAYYEVIAEGELHSVASDRVNRAREQLAVARARVLAGDALSTDSLQLLLELNRARVDMLRRDSALAVARLRLGRVIGSADGVDAVPISELSAPALPLSIEEATAELHARGPAVEASRAEERRARAALSGEREGYLPEISVGAIAGRYDTRFFPSALARSQFSVQLSLPIWDAGRRELDISRARVQLDAAAAARADVERATAEQMAQAYHGYTTAAAEVQLASEAVSVAGENYRVHTVRYREGVGITLDVVQAQVDLVESEASLVRAQHSARIALARIEALLGRRMFD